MNTKKMVLAAVCIAAALTAQAMPTKQELAKVEGLVQDLMQPEMEALKAGRKNCAEVAKAAVALVEEAQSDAARLLLLKGAFSLYTAHGAFDEALEVLKAVKATVPDISSQYMAGMVESALRNVPKSKGGQLYRVLETMRSRVRRQEELKAALAKSAKRPALRSLHVAVAECHACLGDWPKALDEFAKGDNTMAAAVARAEKGDGKMSQKAIADFWWSYATLKDDVQAAMRRHAAEIYKRAIAAGNVAGLVKIQLQRRVDEAKEYGEDPFAESSERRPASAAAPLYCVIDLSAGPNAEKYPVAYMAEPPKDGWTDEYKTTKLVLRRIEPGTFIMGDDQKDESHRVTISKPFYCGIFEVTQKQYELVTGGNPARHKGDMRPVEQVSYDMIRGSNEGAKWPESSAVDADSFIGRLRARTGLDGFDLPTEAQWEWACRAGTKSAFNNGGDSEDDMKKLGRFVLNQKERGWKERYADFARHVPDGKGGNPGHHTVAGSYEPNAWGLYDMHGNVWESCRDWRGELVYGNDPGGSSSGSCRVLRGGSWDNAASVTTSSRRGGCKPSLKSVTYGFRLCCIAAGAMDAAGQK